MRLLLFLLCFAFSLEAVDYKPWFERYLELQLLASYRLQHYNSLDSSHGNIHYSSWDSIVNASLELYPGYPPYQDLEGEIGVSAARTRKNNFTFEDLFVNLKYRWLDDTIDDPCTLVTGLVLQAVNRHALHDPSFFHHGGFEIEAYASIGREDACYDTWQSRKWAILGFGVADLGSPWLRADAHWEKNWCDEHSFGLFAAALIGFGGNSLSLPFHGYGSIAHRSLDIGMNYRYYLDRWCEGYLSLEYFHRIYAKNCPRGVDSLKLEFRYPFCP